jgi:plastocyanin
MPQSRRLRLLAILTSVLALSLLAGSQALASGTQVLHLSSKPNMVLRFSTSHLSAHAGRIELVMHNVSNSGMDHGIAISGHGIKKVGPIVAPGHTSTVTVTLRRGSYTFYCPVPGHEQAGMKGTLTVS